MGESKKESTTAKNELSFSDLPPIADLQITVPESECVEIGTVSGIVDTLGMHQHNNLFQKPFVIRVTTDINNLSNILNCSLFQF